MTTGDAVRATAELPDDSLVSSYPSTESASDDSPEDMGRLLQPCQSELSRLVPSSTSVLQKESVIALIEDKKQISTQKFEFSNVQKPLESNKKEAKSSKYTLCSSLEQVQENNEALKNSLEKTNSRIADLEQSLETTLATENQLQNLLKRKEENNAAVETEGQEIINKLEGEKTRLIQKLNTAENQIKKVSETAEQLQKEIKVLADRLDKATTEKTKLQELQNRVRGQENQITFLENQVKEYKKLQVKFIETEDSNDSRLDEDEPGEITKLVGDINELTLPTDSGQKSLHYVLKIEQTNDFEQTIENLKMQIEHLNKTIIYLEQENQQLKKKVDMGDDNIPTTEQDDEDAKKVNRYFTQPIVKALGELFPREDKKAIPIFKGKSTDKLISERLRGAEHVARNNEWDDNQKIRFFSDRLKGEAFEWHENYVEEEGDDLNYQDWKEALITRFQDTYDVATLENKTAFICEFGQYEFNRMPFGLTNAPSTFQRAINNILQTVLYKFSLVYLDDTGKEQRDTFECIKNCLITRPVLGYPDFSREFIIYMDASGYGIGAVLAQIQPPPQSADLAESDGQDLCKSDVVEVVIAYTSKHLNDCEAKWSITEKEAYAIIHAIDVFRTYLYGRKFTVFTDHTPFEWIMRKSHQNDDTPRRTPIVPLAKVETRSTGTKEKSEVKNENVEAKETRTKLVIFETEKFKINEKGLLADIRGRIVTPVRLVPQILKENHDHILAGHLGAEKTLAGLQRQYTWPCMRTAVIEYVKSCLMCIKRKAVGGSKAPLHSLPLVERVWERIAMDIVGPIQESAKEYRYILVISDYASRFVFTVPMRNQTAQTIAKVSVNKIFTKYGSPEIVLTDQGTNFLSSLIQEVCKLFKVKQIRTTAYHPANRWIV
ncbi:Uncharacterized protein APZ42_027839 [Daphnia magna]|uniref:RNA-directed DNA polymerase n=1 Tax=Daphnia magna TaxID=35525 RepID=A0A164R139_9CRUS|nr:Uncharacterized protein APZ42_027839 [Daphnia magna]